MKSVAFVILQEQVFSFIEKYFYKICLIRSKSKNMISPMESFSKLNKNSYSSALNEAEISKMMRQLLNLKNIF